MNAAIVLIFSALIATQFVMAHGDGSAGPNGGHIQMPASFHTEVVAKEDQTFHIYLTDMEFINPTTQKSEIKVTHILAGKKTELNCRTRKDHYVCQGTQKTNSGTLVIQATRDGVKATSEAKYELPLKPFKTDDHSSHH